MGGVGGKRGPGFRVGAMTRKILFLALLASTPACDRDAAEGDALLPGTWQELTPMPHARTENSVAAADGRIWVMGGFEARHEAETAVDVFDPATGTWKTPTRVPLGVNHAGLAEVDGRLYLIGGYRHGTFEAIDRVQVYDVAAGEWTEGTPMPTGRGALAVAVVDGRIHAIGGVKSDGGVSAAHEVYDPASGHWERRSPMPTRREHLAAAAMGGRIYVAAGRSGGRNLDAFEIYDVAADAWSQGADVPTDRSGVAALILDSRFYLFGGEEIFGLFRDTFDEAERFDPATGTWEAVARMPTARHGLGAAVLDGAIYVVGGGPEPGFTFSGANERFEP